MSIYVKDRTPYTYLIGWSHHNIWYYGARYAKNCHPSDLFVSYFTSSNLVKRYIKNLGNPNVIQVRKTFTNVIECRNWEMKVISRMQICKRKDFLNQRNGGGITNFSTEFTRKSWNKGTKGVQKSKFKGMTDVISKETRSQISNTLKEYFCNIDPNKKKDIYSKRDSCNSRRWMNKDSKHCRVKLDQIEYMISQGWHEGRIINRNSLGKFALIIP